MSLYVETAQQYPVNSTRLTSALTLQFDTGGPALPKMWIRPGKQSDNMLTVGDIRTFEIHYFNATGAGHNYSAVSIARVPAFADGCASCLAFTPSTTGTAGNGVFMRASGTVPAVTVTGYAAVVKMTIAGGSSIGSNVFMEVYKVINNVQTLLATSANKINTATNVASTFFGFAGGLFNVKLQTVGTAIKARFWEHGTPEPTTWDVTLVDASIAAAGVAAFGVLSPYPSAQNPNTFGVSSYLSVSDTAAQESYTPVSWSDRQIFMEESSNASVLLFEAGVLGNHVIGGVNNGVDSKALMSNTGFTTRPGDDPANAVYDGIIQTVGDFTQRMNEALQGRSTQGFGDIKVKNENHKLDDWVRYNWDGREFVLLVGRNSWRRCDFALAARGTIERVEQSASDSLTFKLRDSSNLLARLVTTTLIGGAGPSAALKVPIAYGKVFNVTPVLKDSGTHRYKVHNGAITDILDVRENGSSIIGSVTKDLVNGEFTLTASPAGALTCDVDSAQSQSTYAFPSGSTGDARCHKGIFDALVKNAIPTDLQNSLAYGLEPNNTPQTDSGIFMGPDDTQLDEMLDILVTSNSGYWAWSRWGELTCGRIDLLAADFVIDLIEDDMTNKNLIMSRMILPSAPIDLLYAWNWTVQDAASLDGVVTETNRAIFSQQASRATSGVVLPGGDLDVYSFHKLAGQVEATRTLYYNFSGVAGSLDNSNWGKRAVGIFSFTTRKNALDMEIGMRLRITHQNYGFSGGAIGTIVGISKNYRSRRTKVDVAIKLDGKWPAIADTTYPYVAEGDFE